METRFLKTGDLVKIAVKGVIFEATIEVFGKPGWVKVKPEQSWATWRQFQPAGWVRSNQVVEKLERQERLEVAV